MTGPLAQLGLSVPIVGAPLAGGPSTPELAVAVGAAGGLGFLAGGYKTAAQLGAQITAMRASDRAFGVNLFAPNPVDIDPAAYRRYLAELAPIAARFEVTLAEEPIEDDDDWAAKVDLLLAAPVPLVSFTFGLAPAAVVAALRSAGTITAQTVTSAAEASAAVDSGVDLLVVQAAAAGGHSGTFTPHRRPPATPIVELLAEVRAVTTLPLLAAGGLASSSDIAAVLHAGAAAAVIGTLFVATDESGASAPYKAALLDPGRAGTVVTHSFSGRPARGLRNAFTDRLDELAPLGYPAVHHLTSPLRRAAAAAGDPEWINLWAGTGHRAATGGSAAAVLERLRAGL
jgi:nitronate monooxygenase